MLLGKAQRCICSAWWPNQMETFSSLLALCAGNSPVTGEFPSQRPVTRNFDVFFDLCLNKRLSKQSWGWWFDTPSRSLWRHCNGFCWIGTSQYHSVWCYDQTQIILKHWKGRWWHFVIMPLFPQIVDFPMSFKHPLRIRVNEGHESANNRQWNQVKATKKRVGLLWLQWRHIGRDGFSNHHPHDCLLNRLFRRTKHQSSASLANTPHKGPVTRKTFSFDGVIVWDVYFVSIWIPYEHKNHYYAEFQFGLLYDPAHMD